MIMPLVIIIFVRT